MKKIKRFTLCFLLASSLVISLAGCGSQSANQSMSKDEITEVTEEMAVEDSSDKLLPQVGSSESGAVANTLAAAAGQETVKLIWRADLSMETLEFDKALSQINALIQEKKGFVESSSASGGSDAQGNYINKSAYLTARIPANHKALSQINALIQEKKGFVESSSASGGSDAQGNYINKSAYLTARIPANQLDSFLSDLNGFGSITSQNLSSENISLQYADTQARKEALQTEYDKLIDLMAKAENIDAVIALEARLSEVRLQLDSFSSQLRTYDNLVDYATVEMNIMEVNKLNTVSAVGIGERIQNGFSDTLFGIKTFFENSIVFLVVNLPIFILIAIPVLVVLFLLRKRRQKKNASHMPLDSDREQFPTRQENEQK